MLSIVKRDGRSVPFDSRKIDAAIDRCYRSRGGTPPDGVTRMVVNLLASRDETPTVESVQNAVESVLIALGERDAAKSYMAYRDERARLRQRERITPEIRAAYEAGAAAMGNDPLRVFQFFDKTARYNWDLRRRETWPECVERTIEHLRWLVVRECGADRLTEGEWAEIRDTILACAAMPSMRLLSQAGPAARRDDTAIFNCAYQAVTGLRCFSESLLISMAGCGDAYSVESKFVRQLPFVRHQRGGKPDTFVIPDTSEGWAEALLFGLEKWFDGGDVTYDYSELRDAGAILRTKGGRSSGPGPLRSVLRAVRSLVLSRQGSQLTTVDVNDLMCITGEAGNSGGQRRTAKLSLSDWGDAGMQAAKGTPGWWDTHGYRGNANNSAVWPDGGPSQVELIGQMHAMFVAKSGERGIFSRENSLRLMPQRRADFLRAKGAAENIGCNPCGEIVLQDMQFCNLSIAVARPSDTIETLRRKVRIATILGTIQSLATNFPHLRPEWSKNTREERLLGVDITGQMDCPLFLGGDVGTLMREMATEARRVNRDFAARLGIEESMAITANKPSGNSGAMLDCSPGINARKFRYGIRNARANTHSPVFRVLRACEVPMDPENGQNAETATKWVVHFPMRAPEGAVVESERSALDQLTHWRLNKLNYTEHNPSVTIAYSPDEMIGIIEWLWENRGIVGGISFLPRADSVYRQMPYEETSREEWEKAHAAFPRIDWALLAAFEEEDSTTSSRELACAAGGCETA